MRTARISPAAVNRGQHCRAALHVRRGTNSVATRWGGAGREGGGGRGHRKEEKDERRCKTQFMPLHTVHRYVLGVAGRGGALRGRPRGAAAASPREPKGARGSPRTPSLRKPVCDAAFALLHDGTGRGGKGRGEERREGEGRGGAAADYAVAGGIFAPHNLASRKGAKRKAAAGRATAGRTAAVGRGLRGQTNCLLILRC